VFAFESYLTGILTSLDSSECFRSTVYHFWRQPVDPWLSPDLSHEQESPHNHNSRNCNRIVRERGSHLIQNMPWGKHNQNIICMLYYARVRQRQEAPSGNMRDVVGEEIADNTRGVQGWFSMSHLTTKELKWTELVFLSFLKKKWKYDLVLKIKKMFWYNHFVLASSFHPQGRKWSRFLNIGRRRHLF